MLCFVMSTTAGSTPPAEATWRELIEEARLSLKSLQEARWIAEDVVASPSREINLDAVPDASQRERFFEFVASRARGDPLQLVLGHWSFRSLDLLVDRRALIPRPETEVLVEVALEELSKLQHLNSAPVVVDLGTGSGAVACALVAENGSVHVVATDQSADALELAELNRKRLPESAARRIEFRRGDWFDALDTDLEGRVSLVVSNPPYIARAEWKDLEPAVRDFDPEPALVAGEAGTEAIDAILGGAGHWLARGGAVVLEIAPPQAPGVRATARMHGARHVELRRDLTGRDRVLVARW